MGPHEDDPGDLVDEPRVLVGCVVDLGLVVRLLAARGQLPGGREVNVILE